MGLPFGSVPGLTCEQCCEALRRVQEVLRKYNRINIVWNETKVLYPSIWRRLITRTRRNR